MLESYFLYYVIAAVLIPYANAVSSGIGAKVLSPFFLKSAVKQTGIAASKQTVDQSLIHAETIENAAREMAQLSSNLYNEGLLYPNFSLSFQVNESTFLFALFLICYQQFGIYQFCDTLKKLKKLEKSKNEKNLVGEITWDYLCGLFETDGTFNMSLEKTKGIFKPIASTKISQTDKTGLLIKIQGFLSKYGMKSTFDRTDPTNKNARKSCAA